MAGFRDFVADAPDEINASATWWSIPAVPGFPDELHGREVLISGALYAGPATEGEAQLMPLRQLAEPILDLSTPLPFTALQQLFDPFFPQGEARYYWKSLYLAGLGNEVVDEIVAWMQRRPSPMSMAGVWALGGALGRVDPDATAVGERTAPFLLEILANWVGARGDRAQRRLGARLLRRHGALRHRQDEPEFPGPRRGRSVRPCGVWPELRAPRRAEAEVRSDQPVPPEPEYRPPRRRRVGHGRLRTARRLIGAVHRSARRPRAPKDRFHSVPCSSSTRSKAAPDAAASRNRAAHMAGVSKVARVQASRPAAAAISSA